MDPDRGGARAAKHRAPRLPRWRRAGRWVAAAGAVAVTMVSVGLPLATGEDSTPAPAERAGGRSAVDLEPGDATSEPSTEPTGEPTAEAGRASRPRLDRGRHSLRAASSPWVVVNKARPIRPRDYRPPTEVVRGYQVARRAAGPLARLLDESDRRALGLRVASAFRSFDYQVGVYDDTVATLGQAAADRRSARPGHSEHQTGLAVDLVDEGRPECSFAACFADTPGGSWVADNAWRYGFLVRYQPGDVAVTGYDPEPWHLRYVGEGLARELRRTGVTTLEEFFDVRGGDYRSG